MKDKPTIDEKIVEWIESHRITIGIVLIFIILAGAITLSVMNAKPAKIEQPEVVKALEGQLSELKQQNDLLRKQIEAQTKTQVLGTQATSPISSSKPSQTSPPQKISGKININTANKSALESLPKIGPTIAQRIIDYRTQNGLFKTIEEIKNVKGIGDKTFEALRDKITIE